MTSRRELMQWLAASTGLAGLESIGARDLFALGLEAHRAASAAPVAPSPLDPRIGTAAEIILPGAGDAGVSAFIEHMLNGWYTPAERDRFVAGLRALDDRSRSAHGSAFADAAPADQVVLLTTMDADVTAIRARSGAEANQHWFAILKYLTIWGYCTSAAGAEALGLTAMPMRYDGNAPR